MARTERMRVLVAVRERRPAELIRARLKAHRFAVEVTCDGAEALTLAAARPFSVVVLDLALPTLGGGAVCLAMRARHDRTPVLLLGSDGGEAAAQRAGDLGADGYLATPCSLADVLDAVVALDGSAVVAD